MRKQKYISGFSLVELMVAMVISLFLTLGVFAMFSMSATNVTTTGQYNQLQENGRIALAIMAPDIEQTAFFGDFTGSDFVQSNTTITGAISGDCIGPGTNDATLPDITSTSHFRLIWGYEVLSGGQSVDCVTNAMEGTDVIQLKRLMGPAGATNGFRVATTSSQVIFFGTAADPAIENERVWEYLHHVYFIRCLGDTQNASCTAKGNVPVLSRKALSSSGVNNEEQLVEGIENMRILYGYDDDGDDTPDSFLPVEDVTDLMWDNQSFQRIVAVKIFLLVRTIDQDNSYTNDITYELGDKKLGPFNDHYRRKVLSTTVVLENPVLIRN
ncbi:PilW family protein [Shewanella yunxiaonensis]|uniref:PilW family protein n=1 Tax=Shewanella yunxiaonensis TaxID=2829809 RepID=A0ABX7YQW2_9GAMM|nr:PilW family protein [Shewanella yunxiaonensis]QUN04913.1 PilW family protein [Shewanella yunxiaonensis]